MTEEMWSETALVSISKIDGIEREFYTICDSVDFKVGMKDVDFIATLRGGRLSNFKPMEATEVTLKVYPTEVGGTAAGNVNGCFDLFCSGTNDSTQPLSFTVDRDRSKFRVAFLVTNDTTVTSAAGAVASGSEGARLVAKNGYCVEATPTEYTPESGWVWTLRFKFPPFTKNGVGNITGESCDTTATMSALGAYTSS